MRNVAATHPVMIGFPKEWLDTKDELYKNEKLWEHFTKEEIELYVRRGDLAAA